MPSREWERLTDGERQIIRNHQAEFPVRLSQIAKDLGLPIQAATLAPGISGELRPTGPEAYAIRVNRHDPVVRQRFTVAHEIAHFLLHRGEIGQGIRDDVLYRSALSDAREAEANRLAADILMPDEDVREAYQRGSRDDEAVLQLAERFGVSEVAMKIRLGL